MRQRTHIPEYNAVKISIRIMPVYALFCTMQGRPAVVFVHLQAIDIQFESAQKSDDGTHCSLMLPRQMGLLPFKPELVVSVCSLETGSPSRSRPLQNLRARHTTVGGTALHSAAVQRARVRAREETCAETGTEGWSVWA